MFWRIQALSLRIIQQFLRDRRTLALLFIAPLVIMTILQFALQSTTATANLGIAASDSVAQVLLPRIKQQLSSQSQIVISQTPLATVDQRLQDGTYDGILIIPDSTLVELQQGTLQTLTLRLEGSNPATAHLLKNIVALLMNGLNSATPPTTPTIHAQNHLRYDTTYLYGGPEFTQTDTMAPLFVGLFSFFFVFLLTSVAFLRERSQGTIERVMVSPLSRTELVLGYVIGFTFFAMIQSILILLYVIFALQVHYHGNPMLLFLVTIILTIGGVNMGIFASAFARTELQVIQFIPLLIVPQILLGGLFFPISTLPPVLKQLAYLMPLTYANFALKDIMVRGFGFGEIWPDLVFLAGFATLMIAGAAISLRQEKA